MTRQEIAAMVGDIELEYLASDDDQRAHSEQDKLWVLVLSAIAEGKCLNPAECAREALKVMELDFRRWYA